MPTTVYVARDGSGGYNCDGAADEVQINQAIDFVYNNSASGYTTVYLKAGTYVISDPIRIRSGVTLCGAGKSSVTIKLANNITTNSSSDYYVPSGWEDSYGPMVPLIWSYGSTSYISNGTVTGSNKAVDSVSFYGFTLDGNYGNNSRLSRGRGYHNGIGLQYSTNVSVHDCHFTNSAGDGVRLYGSTSTKTSNLYVYNNTANNLGHDAVFVLYGSNVYVYNNNIEARVNSCVRFNDVTNGHIYDNILHANLTYDSNPVIQLQRHHWASMSVEVNNNIIYESWGAGMWITWGRSPQAVADSGANTKIHVHHNMFYNNGTNHSIPYTAAIITDGIHNVYIENNNFIGNHGGGVVVMGMTTSATCPFSGIKVYVKNNIFYYNKLRKLNAAGTSTESNTGWGVQNRLTSSHTVICSYNCFYGNDSGTYTGTSINEGNIGSDPLFANVSLTTGYAAQDCHLKSQYGRKYNGAWTQDGVHSPCIDKGDPSYDYSLEPEDNGNRIDIGLYGNTAESSLSSAIINAVDSATLKDTRIESANPDTNYSTTTYLDIGASVKSTGGGTSPSTPSPPSTIYVGFSGTTSDYYCDGTDDHIQIQYALNEVAALNNGSSVYLRGPFNYRIRDQLKLGRNMIFEGDSSAVLTLHTDALWDQVKPMMVQANTSNFRGHIVIRGFEVNGQAETFASKFPDTYSGDTALRGDGFFTVADIYYDDIEIYNVYWHDTLNDGLITRYSQSIKIHDSFFYRCGHEAINPKRSNNLEVWNCRIRTSNNSAIRPTSTNHVKIHNNEIYSEHWLNPDGSRMKQPGGAGGPGIQIQYESNAGAMNDIEIYENVIHSTFGPGIVAVISGGSFTKSDTTNLRIHHNVFYHNGWQPVINDVGGILIGGWDAIIENNVFDDCYNTAIGTMNGIVGVSPPSGMSGFSITCRNNIFMYTRQRTANTSGTGFAISNLLNGTHTVTSSYNCYYQNVGTTKNVTVSNDINADPYVANRTAHDYHLKSLHGRWNGTAWVKDAVQSPCIDAGNPSSSYSNEPEDNGNRIDIGRYGNTAESSLSTSNVTPTVIGGETGEASVYRSLLWFDLSDYMGKVVETAQISLYWFQPTSATTNPTTLEVYRPIVWDSSKVTWNKKNATANWSSAGGDWYDKNGALHGASSYASATYPSNTIAQNKYYTLDVKNLVQLYLSGTYENTGFLLKAGNEAVSNRIAWYSTNSGSSLTIPKLTIKTSGEIPTTAPIYVSNSSGTGQFKCDGVNDEVQINQAIKLAKDNPLQYSGVYLQGPNIYTISNPILVAGILEGDESATIRLVDNANWESDLALIRQYETGLNNIVIRGFKVDGNREGNTNVLSGKGFYNLMHISNCSNVNIYNMYLTNNHNDGVKLSSCSGVNYHDNDIYLLGHDGLYAINSTYVNAYNNNITCRTNSGLRLYNTNYVKFYNNTITSQGSGGAGIEVQKYGTPNMNDIEIYNNVIHGTVLAGIWVFSSSSYNADTAKLNIHNNVIYNTGTKSTDLIAGGIVISGFSADIDNNTIDGCYRSGIGIREVYSPGATITGTVTINIRSNNITNTIGTGIDYTTLANHSIAQINNCMYNNSAADYSNVSAPTGDNANITVDPLYADQANHNYYLKSKGGRWSSTQTKWVVDAVSSPCIDAGYVNAVFTNEPDPNGGRVNIGAYGNTIHASLSGDAPIATNNAPVLDALTNKTITIGSTLTFTLTATDVDNDTLTYVMSSTPTMTGATLNENTGVFSWLPTTGQDGTYSVTFVVSDGIDTDSQTISIGVIKQEMFSVSSGTIYTNRLKETTPTTVYNKLSYIDVGARLIEGVNRKYRDLVMVDLSEYAGKTIISANLCVYWFFPDGRERVNDTVIEVYRPLPWDTAYATWNSRNETTTWLNPGGDWYDAEDTLSGSVPYASASFVASTVPDNAYHELDVTALVQAYVNNTYINTGFFIKAQTEANNYIAFYSQNFALTSAILKLVVEYTD